MVQTRRIAELAPILTTWTIANIPGLMGRAKRRAALLREQRLTQSAVARMLTEGSLWMLLGNVSTVLVSVLLSVGLGRLFGVRDYGRYGLIQGTIATAGVLAGFGMNNTSNRFVAYWSESQPETCSGAVRFLTACAWGAGALVALTVAILSGMLSGRLLKDPTLQVALLLATAGLPAQVVNGVQLGVLSGLAAFREYAFVLGLRAVAPGALTIAGAVVHGVEGAMLGGTMGWFAVTWASGTTQKTSMRMALLPERGALTRAQKRELLNFATPSFLGGLLSFPTFWLSSLILARQPNGFREVGAFSVANQWRTATSFLPNIMAAPFTTAMAAALGIGKWQRLRKLVWACCIAMTGASAAIACVVCLLAAWVVSWYGKGFEESVTALRILASTGIEAGLVLAIMSALNSMKRVWMNAMLNLIWAVSLIGMTLWLVPHGGAKGLSYAYLLGYGVQAAIGLGCIVWVVSVGNRAPNAGG